MKVFVPIEIPDGSYTLSISATAASPEEIREINYTYEESEIERFYRYTKLSEEAMVKYGLI